MQDLWVDFNFAGKGHMAFVHRRQIWHVPGIKIGDGADMGAGEEWQVFISPGNAPFTADQSEGLSRIYEQVQALHEGTLPSKGQHILSSFWASIACWILQQESWWPQTSMSFGILHDIGSALRWQASGLWGVMQLHDSKSSTSHVSNLPQREGACKSGIWQGSWYTISVFIIVLSRFAMLQVAGIQFKSLLNRKRGSLTAGGSKSAHWLTSTGPLLKFLLAGCPGSQEQRGLFQYIDVLRRLWSKTSAAKQMEDVAKDCRTSLAEMELHFPGSELTISRHMVLHLADAIQVSYSCP